jgi:SAM-dependent methyltransferase
MPGAGRPATVQRLTGTYVSANPRFVMAYRDPAVDAIDPLRDPTRRAIFERLGRGACTVEELADELPVGQPLLSQHLAVLTDAELVVVHTSGTRRIYRIEPNYDELYAGKTSPPWEIGKPQPALAALIDQIDIESPVLDVGCGTGDLAIHLTEKGHGVVGIDASEPGVAKARSKAAEKGLDIAFRVADARRLQELELRPRSVFDSGLLHNLDDDGQLAYVAGLEAICDPGALVCVLAVSTEAGMGWGVTRDALTRAFAEPDWAETTIEPADVLAVIDGEEFHLPAFLLTTRRL